METVGDYYQALHLYRQGDKDTALGLLDNVRNEAPLQYKDKALLVMGGIAEHEGDLDEAMRVRLVASKSEMLSVVLDAALGISAVLGSQGKHDQAVEYLEGILPLTSKLGQVPLNYDLRNSYAVELGEVGKLDQALKVIDSVVASPFVPFYPNWPETRLELKSRRSTVSVTNVVEFPKQEEPEPVEQYGYPYSEYIEKEFRIDEKVEDWVYGSAKPDDLGTLMIALSESDPEFEKDMIIEKVIDSVFTHSKEAKKAKKKWRNRLVSKIK